MREPKNHGMGETREFNIWRNMKQRCGNPKHPDFPRYGARGIAVCERWLTFSNFFADMGLSHGLTLERVRNSEGYCPENCEWVTRQVQARNTRRNAVFTHNGVTASLVEHCGGYGNKYKRVWARINSYGWTIEEALA